MLFSTLIVALSAAPLALANPFAKRADNGNKVLADVEKINADLVTLNKTLNTFGTNAFLSLPIALEIQSQTQQIETDLKTAISDSSSSSNFTYAESTNIAQQTVFLVPVIQSTLSNLVSHKQAFATAVFGFGDLSQTVEGDLQTLDQLSKQFGAAVTPKLTQPWQNLAPVVLNQIQAAFDTALKAYSTCSGVLCLPPLNGFPI